MLEDAICICGIYHLCMEKLQSDIGTDAEGIALIFEGGGMRNAYTAAVVATLLEDGIRFPKVYGISAGSALATDYVAKDAQRAKATFVDSVELHRSGGIISFLTGHGFFDTRYIFEKLAVENAGKDDKWTFDMSVFEENPADVHIEAFARDSGATVAWTKTSMHTLEDAMERVAASCSYPLFTPPVYVDGTAYVDGGMGTSHGICLDAAIRDGFERFFIVRTQPRDYRMPELDRRKRLIYRIAYRKYPYVYDALVARPHEYNALLDRVEGLRKSGAAYVFCPESMPITCMTTDFGKLQHAYDLGRSQSLGELEGWLHWICG